MATTTRRAACNCGQLHLTIEGEPSRISMCHCLECQRRTGAVVGNQAPFRREQIGFAGTATEYTRSADSGNALTSRFCPHCGSTVYWTGTGFRPRRRRHWHPRQLHLPRADGVGMGRVPPPLAATAVRRPHTARGEAGLSCHPETRAARIRDPGPFAPPLAAPCANVIPAPLGREAYAVLTIVRPLTLSP